MNQLTKIIYVVLVILILLMPHVQIGHLLSVPEPYAQSAVTMTLLIIAYGIYHMHRSDIYKKEQEKQKVEEEFLFSSSKLNDAYQYIGSVNRKIPLFHDMSTGLIRLQKGTKKGQRAIFEELLMTAVTTLGHTSFGTFRFINLGNGRTEKEFTQTTKGYILLKTNISNNELMEIAEAPGRITEMNNMYVISTSDRDALIRCFLIFSRGENSIETEVPILQAITDQAQLFYKYLSENVRNK